MTTEKPQPDRCGARVVDKVGIEIHYSTDPDSGEYDHVLTDEDIETIVLSDGSEEVREEAEYEEVIGYLHHGYSVSAVILSDPEQADVIAGEDGRVPIDDDDPYVTNRDTELQGYCERYPMDNGRCYNHGGMAEGAPEGNQRAMTHGLRASRSNYYENLDDEEKAFVHQLADSWIDDAPFDRDNFAKATEVMRIAIDQLRLWKAHEELNEGLITEQTVEIDGEMQDIVDENPANLPYDRLDRTTTRKLKELGCLDDPDSQQAEATESLADKFKQIDDN